jgi:hypothetical protein
VSAIREIERKGLIGDRGVHRIQAFGRFAGAWGWSAMAIEMGEGRGAEDRTSALLFAQFREVARRAALFELGVRLLADDTDGLSTFAAEEELTRLVDRLVSHFSSKLSGDEQALLPWCSATRNELFAPARPTEIPGADRFGEVSLRFAQAIQILGRLRLEED